jgi:hypothetical protein
MKGGNSLVCYAIQAFACNEMKWLEHVQGKSRVQSEQNATR